MTLGKLIKVQQKGRDRFLVPLLFALRDAVHEGHGFTPFVLVYGRSTRSPMKIVYLKCYGREKVIKRRHEIRISILYLQQKNTDTCIIAQ